MSFFIATHTYTWKIPQIFIRVINKCQSSYLKFWGAFILKDIVCNGKKSQIEAQGTDFSICVFVYYSISCKYWVPLVLSFWRLSQWFRLKNMINILLCMDSINWDPRKQLELPVIYSTQLAIYFLAYREPIIKLSQ